MNITLLFKYTFFHFNDNIYSLFPSVECHIISTSCLIFYLYPWPLTSRPWPQSCLWTFLSPDELCVIITVPKGFNKLKKVSSMKTLDAKPGTIHGQTRYNSRPNQVQFMVKPGTIQGQTRYYSRSNQVQFMVKPSTIKGQTKYYSWPNQVQFTAKPGTIHGQTRYKSQPNQELFMVKPGTIQGTIQGQPGNIHGQTRYNSQPNQVQFMTKPGTIHGQTRYYSCSNQVQFMVKPGTTHGQTRNNPWSNQVQFTAKPGTIHGQTRYNSRYNSWPNQVLFTAKRGTIHGLCDVNSWHKSSHIASISQNKMILANFQWMKKLLSTLISFNYYDKHILLISNRYTECKSEWFLLFITIEITMYLFFEDCL